MRGLFALAGVALVAGCGGDSESAGNSSPCDVVVVDPDRSKEITPLESGRKYRIEFETTHGSFTVELDEERSPCNGNSLMQLAEDGFFDGVTIHRIVPDFVIQAGRSDKTPDGGPGYTTIDPPLPDTRYTEGVVAMAKTSADPPGTGGSEFFVVTGSDLQLPPDYASIGRIVQGTDVIERIGKLGSVETQRPTEKIVIKRAHASGP